MLGDERALRKINRVAEGGERRKGGLPIAGRIIDVAIAKSAVDSAEKARRACLSDGALHTGR